MRKSPRLLVLLSFLSFPFPSKLDRSDSGESVDSMFSSLSERKKEKEGKKERGGGALRSRNRWKKNRKWKTRAFH